MKKILNHLKLRQLRWLASLVAFIIALESTSNPAQGWDLQTSCKDIMAKIATYKAKRDAAQVQKDAKKAQEKKEGDIRRAQTTALRPLQIDEKLLAYYKDHPDEVEGWLQSIKQKKEKGLVTDVEDLTAYALTSQKAQELLGTLIERKNIYINYGSAWDLFHIFDLQKNQATVKKSSRIPLWFWKIFKRNYSRAFTITLQRKVPSTEYEEYADSIGLDLFMAQESRDLGFTMRDLKRKGAALIAAGQAFYGKGRVEVDYEGTGFEPIDETIKELILRMYPTALEIANSREDVVSLVKNHDLVNNLVLDLNQKKTLDSTTPSNFVNRLINRTAQREIPKSLFTALKVGFVGFIVWITGKKIILGFLPAGAGQGINGNNMVNNAACEPTHIDYEDVMTEQPGMSPINPFQTAFIGQNKKDPNQPNPCDPDYKLQKQFKEIMRLNDNNEENYEKWVGLNQDVISEMREQIRARFKYTDPKKPSACAQYYAWVNCPQNSK